MDPTTSSWSGRGGSRRWAFGEGSTGRSGIDVASALTPTPARNAAQEMGEVDSGAAAKGSR
jgi:hypothetical protein